MHDRLLSMFLRNPYRVTRGECIDTCFACGIIAHVCEIHTGDLTIMLCDNCNKSCSIRLYVTDMDKQFVDNYPRMLVANQAETRRYVIKQLLCGGIKSGFSGMGVCICCYHYSNYKMMINNDPVCCKCGIVVTQMLEEMCTKGMYIGAGDSRSPITRNDDVDGHIRVWLCRVYAGV